MLVTSPEVLVFLFFMITDPKTTPKVDARPGRSTPSSIGLLARAADRAGEDRVLGEGRAPRRARDRLRRRGRCSQLVPATPPRPARRSSPLGAVALARLHRRDRRRRNPRAARDDRRAARAHGPAPAGDDPAVEAASRPSLDRKTAHRIAADLVADLQAQTAALIARRPGALARASIGDELSAADSARSSAARGGPIDVPAYRLDQMRVQLEPGHGQGGAIAVAALAGIDAADELHGGPRRTARPARGAGAVERDTRAAGGHERPLARRACP